MNPLDDRKQQGSKRFSLAPLWGKMLLLLYTGTAETRALSESDGKLTVSNYGKAGSTSTAFSVETTGEQRIVTLGHDGSALQRIKTETSREQAVTNYSKKSDATIVAQRVDAAGFQRVRLFEPYEATAVVPINTTATTIYTVPASTVSVVEVELTNTDTVANTVDFHIVASGGSASVSNIILQDYSIPFATTPIRLGPYHLGAGVFLQALVTTGGGSNGDVNAIAIVKEYGAGDAIALV